MARSKPKPKEEKLALSFSLARAQLLGMLARCDGAKTKNILIQAKELDPHMPRGEVSITAMGMPVSVVTRAWTEDKSGSAMVHKGGDCALALADLQSVVSAMPDDMLDIDCTLEGRMRIVAAGHADKPKARTFSVQTLEASEYPPVPKMPATTRVRTISGTALGRLIDRVGYACEKRDLNKATAGVLVTLSEGQIEAVATDSHVLAVCSIGAKVSDPREEFLLPAPMLGLCVALAADTLELAQDEQRIYLSTDHTFVSCLRAIAAFPQWQYAVNGIDAKPCCELDGPQLAEALRALGAVWKLSYASGADFKDRGAPVRCELEDGELTLSSGLNTLGDKRINLAQGEECLEVKNPNGVTWRSKIELTLLMQSAQHAEGIVRLSAGPKDPDIPCILESSGDSTFKAVVMPIRWDESQ